MVKQFALILGFILWALQGSGQAGEVSRQIAAGEWSQPVSDQRGYAVRGRLVLCEKPSHPDGLREVVVYVELQDCSDFIGNTMRLYCEMGPHDFRPETSGGLKCKLSKADKILIEPTGFLFGGATPKSEWLTLRPTAPFG